MFWWPGVFCSCNQRFIFRVYILKMYAFSALNTLWRLPGVFSWCLRRFWFCTYNRILFCTIMSVCCVSWLCIPWPSAFSVHSTLLCGGGGGGGGEGRVLWWTDCGYTQLPSGSGGGGLRRKQTGSCVNNTAEAGHMHVIIMHGRQRTFSLWIWPWPGLRQYSMCHLSVSASVAPGIVSPRLFLPRSFPCGMYYLLFLFLYMYIRVFLT
jgi:hypothetical protein